MLKYTIINNTTLCIYVCVCVCVCVVALYTCEFIFFPFLYLPSFFLHVHLQPNRFFFFFFLLFCFFAAALLMEQFGSGLREKKLMQI